MGWGTRRWRGIVPLALAMAAASAPAHAATPFGSDLLRQPATAAVSCPSPCTRVATGFPAANLLPAAAPLDGVIVSFGYRSASADEVTFRLARPAPGSPNARGAGTGPTVTLTGDSNVHTVPARLPVRVGDLLALDSSATTAGNCQNADLSRTYIPPLQDGGGFDEPVGSGCELLINAVLEPDAEQDGFGDETQDNCPGTFNPDQADSDGDRVGDACEAPPPPSDCTGNVSSVSPFTGDGRNYQAANPAAPNPLIGERWFVDPEEPSFKDWQMFTRRGETENAELMLKIAREPKFRWFGKFSRPNVTSVVNKFLRRAQCAQPGVVPLMAILRGESNKCTPGYAGGGRKEDRRHKLWLEDFARAVGNARVVIAYEPDSLGTIDCLRPNRRKPRLRMLRYGVTLLSRLPNATVYIEAGASDWEPAPSMARKLRAVGVSKVRGFMLNVTHSDWTSANTRFGRQLSRRLSGKHFIINTAIAGQGPTHVYRRVNGKRRRRTIWCNAPTAGLGPRPTTETGDPLVDAYMWIGRPGYSGGACNGGPAPAGKWWREHALKLARRASENKGP